MRNRLMLLLLPLTVAFIFLWSLTSVQARFFRGAAGTYYDFVHVCRDGVELGLAKEQPNLEITGIWRVSDSEPLMGTEAFVLADAPIQIPGVGQVQYSGYYTRKWLNNLQLPSGTRINMALNETNSPNIYSTVVDCSVDDNLPDLDSYIFTGDFSSNGGDILQGEVVTFTLPVVLTNTVGDVNVAMYVEHQPVSDLSAVLRSPAGTAVQLFAAVGGSGSNFGGRCVFKNQDLIGDPMANFVLDDDSVFQFGEAAVVAPFTETAVKPAQPLGASTGEDGNGTWELVISNSGTTDAYLWCWFLQIYDNPNPALSLVKSATPGTYSAVDAIISYSYLVTNTGDTNLAGPVTVSDNKATVTCPAVTTVGNNDGVLDPGESLTCGASYTITQSDLNAGTVTNTATASAAGTDSNQDQETVTANQSPALALVKSATPTTYSAVDEIIGYSYLVTNTGNISLAGPVTVSDDKVNVICPAVTTVGNHDGVLDPGESLTCSASYTITQLDLGAGSVTNTATASAAGADSNQDQETVTANQDLALALAKSATPTTYSAVDEIIGYSYLVTNTGNIGLAGPVTVSDDKATVTCPDVTTVGNNDGNLDPGEGLTCSASYTITQADLNAGSVTNTAMASAAGTDSNQDQETVAVQNPALALVKSATPMAYRSVDEIIGYSYLVTNAGNVSLAGPATVTDDKVIVTCPDVTTVGNNDGNLDPGESLTCSASYTITQADLDAGSVTNIATASADGFDSNQDQLTIIAGQILYLPLIRNG